MSSKDFLFKCFYKDCDLHYSTPLGFRKHLKTFPHRLYMDVSINKKEEEIFLKKCPNENCEVKNLQKFQECCYKDVNTSDSNCKISKINIKNFEFLDDLYYKLSKKEKNFDLKKAKRIKVSEDELFPTINGIHVNPNDLKIFSKHFFRQVYFLKRGDFYICDIGICNKRFKSLMAFKYHLNTENHDFLSCLDNEKMFNFLEDNKDLKPGVLENIKLNDSGQNNMKDKMNLSENFFDVFGSKYKIEALNFSINNIFQHMQNVPDSVVPIKFSMILPNLLENLEKNHNLINENLSEISPSVKNFSLSSKIKTGFMSKKKDIQLFKKTMTDFQGSDRNSFFIDSRSSSKPSVIKYHKTNEDLNNVNNYKYIISDKYVWKTCLIDNSFVLICGDKIKGEKNDFKFSKYDSKKKSNKKCWIYNYDHNLNLKNKICIRFRIKDIVKINEKYFLMMSNGNVYYSENLKNFEEFDFTIKNEKKLADSNNNKIEKQNSKNQNVGKLNINNIYLMSKFEKNLLICNLYYLFIVDINTMKIKKIKLKYFLRSFCVRTYTKIVYDTIVGEKNTISSNTINTIFAINKVGEIIHLYEFETDTVVSKVISKRLGFSKIWSFGGKIIIGDDVDGSLNYLDEPKQLFSIDGENIKKFSPSLHTILNTYPTFFKPLDSMRCNNKDDISFLSSIKDDSFIIATYFGELITYNQQKFSIMTLKNDILYDDIKKEIGQIDKSYQIVGSYFLKDIDIDPIKNIRKTTEEKSTYIYIIYKNGVIIRCSKQ